MTTRLRILASLALAGPGTVILVAGIALLVAAQAVVPKDRAGYAREWPR